MVFVRTIGEDPATGGPNDVYFSIDGPKWSDTERKFQPAWNSVEDLLDPDENHRLAVRVAADRLESTSWIPAYVGETAGFDVWRRYLLRVVGDASADQRAFAAIVVRKDTPVLSGERPRLMLSRLNKRGTSWEDKVVPVSPPTWLLQFWNGYLVVGTQDTEQKRWIDILRVADLARICHEQGDLFAAK